MKAAASASGLFRNREDARAADEDFAHLAGDAAMRITPVSPSNATSLSTGMPTVPGLRSAGGGGLRAIKPDSVLPNRSRKGTPNVPRAWPWLLESTGTTTNGRRAAHDRRASRVAPDVLQDRIMISGASDEPSYAKGVELFEESAGLEASRQNDAAAGRQGHHEPDINGRMQVERPKIEASIVVVEVKSIGFDTAAGNR